MQQPLTCVEICAGAGGQALGLAMAGFVHVALVEYEQSYCNVLKANRPEWNVICADVHDFDSALEWHRRLLHPEHHFLKDSHQQAYFLLYKYGRCGHFQE